MIAAISFAAFSLALFSGCWISRPTASRKISSIVHEGAMLTSCVGCHEQARPKGALGVPPFDHSVAGMGDCVSCHLKPGISWQGGKYAHAPAPNTCSFCHSSERPSSLALLPTNATKNFFLHSTPFNGTGDCVSCHIQTPANIGVSWTGGYYDHKSNGGMSVGTCLPCHASEKPKTLIGTPVFDHSNIGTQDCFDCHKNAGVSWAGAGYNHMPVPATCINCHMGSVPAATTLVPPGASSNLYLHNTKFNGTLDCVGCHMQVPTNVGVRWAGGYFNHKENTGTAVTTCLPCHQNQRPSGIVGAMNFDHAVGGTGDCVSCHKSPGVSWTGGTFVHDPVPTACSTCHNGQRPAATTLLPSGSTRNLYVHASGFNGLSDCTGCHTKVSANIGVRWAGGYYDHKNSGGMAVTTCFPCHQNERPTAPIGNPLFDHSATGTTDCASCHKNPGVSWAGGMGFNHVPTPTSCSSCHSGALPSATTLLPAGATIDLYQHAATFNGTSDCVSCHTRVVANVGVRWAGGYWDHRTSAGTLFTSTCLPCHQGQRPTGTVGTPPYDHANGGMGDCASCHKNSGVSWAGGTFNHVPTPTNCSTCHAGKLPGPTTLLPAGATRNLYEHATTFNGTADCLGCHTRVPANIGVTWAGGYYDHKTTGGATLTATCYPCHQNERPVGPVGSPLFDHANGGTGDCASCHKNPGISWSGGLFSHNPVPRTCANCHAGDVPSGTVPNTRVGFNHATTYGTECYACHTLVAANIGVSWKAGFFGHNNNNAASFTNCSPCHDTYRHKAGTNCAKCHNIVWPKPTTTGVYQGQFN